MPDVLDRVPDHVKFLACALHWAPEVWRNDAAIADLMAVRAYKEAHIRTVVDMVRTQTFFIEQHLAGHLEQEVAPVQPLQLVRSYFEDDDGLQLAPEQKRVVDNVNRRVDQALQAREETKEEELERL